MFKKFMGHRPTSKADVVMAIAGAIIGIWKATDTIKDYKAEKEASE